MVILVWASEAWGSAKTNANSAGKFQIRYFANSFILSLSLLASRLAEITQTTAKDLHPSGPFDVFGELVLVLPRVRHALAPTRPFRIERLNPRANKVWPCLFQRHLHLFPKRRDLLNRVRALDAACFCHLLQVHFAARRRRHSRFFFVASQIIAIVHDEDSLVGLGFIWNRAQDAQVQDEVAVSVKRDDLTIRQRHG